MRGRPPKKPEERLSENCPFRCTKEEKDRILRAALRAGVSVNRLLRGYLKPLLVER
jgi:predicted HicB family RNase H-like nuclease